jgi:hypothetical protein
VKIGSCAPSAKHDIGKLVHACGKMLRNREEGKQSLPALAEDGEKAAFLAAVGSDFMPANRVLPG